MTSSRMHCTRLGWHAKHMCSVPLRTMLCCYQRDAKIFCECSSSLKTVSRKNLMCVTARGHCADSFDRQFVCVTVLGAASNSRYQLPQHLRAQHRVLVELFSSVPMEIGHVRANFIETIHHVAPSPSFSKREHPFGNYCGSHETLNFDPRNDGQLRTRSPPSHSLPSIHTTRTEWASNHISGLQNQTRSIACAEQAEDQKQQSTRRRNHITIQRHGIGHLVIFFQQGFGHVFSSARTGE